MCSHGGLPLDAFIISPSDATVPRGGDVTARSMSSMKEDGRSGCQGLVGRDKFNQKCPEIGRQEGTMWRVRLRACTSGLYTVSQPRPRGLGMQIANHMLPFMTLSLFVSSLSLSGTQSNGQSAPRTKGSIGILSATLTARSSCVKCQTGLR